jgi:uncharacterized protein YaaN involved in tellurite resistance
MADQQTTTKPATTDDLAVAVAVLDRELVQDLQIELDGPVAEQIDRAARELDLDDTNSIIFFGSKAQTQLTTISDSMLEQVRTKDVGPAGNALNRMVQKLRDLDVTGVDARSRPGLIRRLLGVKNQVQQYIDRYEEIRGQIDTISNDLERHKTTLLTDIVRLDKLYEALLEYFRTLEVYIAAGRAKLRQLDDDVLPGLAAKVEAGDDVIAAQKLRDLRGARDDLERRVHDLLLTRQVTMQALPSIRLIQENDKSLVTKINSTVANTVPLWRQQLAQAITIYRMGEASDAVKAASDLTNELLQANAENLKTANAQVRREVERGVFDIEAVRNANQQLVDTINESLQIADEGQEEAGGGRAAVAGVRGGAEEGAGVGQRSVAAGSGRAAVRCSHGSIRGEDKRVSELT